MSAPVHITFLVRFNWGSPWAVRSCEVGSRLAKAGVRVSFIIDDTEANKSAVPPPGTTFERVKVGGLMTQVASMREAVQKLQPDWLHVLNPSLKAYLVVREFPKLQVLGDWGDWMIYFRLAPHRKVLERMLDAWLRKRSDAIIVSSMWLKGRFAELGRSDAYYAPWAVLPVAMPEARPEIFRAPTAVYMGSFTRDWDHGMVLEAAKLLKDQGKKPPILMMGAGPTFEHWKQFRDRHGLDNVELPGFVAEADMLERLRAAHVLLFPITPRVVNLSRCPFKAFQYAQARRPVVTCKVGEVPAVLGDQASYVEPTPEAFATEIERALEQPRAADVDYGVEAQNWDARAEVYLKALGERSGLRAARVA